MNPLEALKQKLKVKPNVGERERVDIVIKEDKTKQKAKARELYKKKEEEEENVVEEILKKKKLKKNNDL